jgi:hypothetical protein
MLPESALRGMRPLFITPTSGVSVTVNYVTSLIALVNAAWERGLSCQTKIGPADSLVTRARSSALAYFLRETLFTHLFWIDGDVGFPPDAAFRLLLSGHDVVAGPYPVKTMVWPAEGVTAASREDFDLATNFFPVNAAEGHQPMPLVVDADGFMEVSEAPTGFMAIKRQVFEAMMTRYPELAFTPDEAPGGPLKGFSWRFFDVMVEPETNRYLSEDYGFCRRWRDMGGRVFVDTTAKLTHQGSHLFRGDYAASLAARPSNACGPA